MPKSNNQETALERELFRILPDHGEEKKAIVKAMLNTRGMMKERYVLLRKEGIVRKSLTSKGEGLGQPLTAEQIAEQKKSLSRTPYSDWAGELLDPSEAAKALGVSRTTLNNWKQDGEIIALPKGKTHSVIPMAQFEEGSILSGIKEVLAAAYGNKIAAWRWLVYPHVDFDGDAPIDSLRDGKVDEVARLAAVSLS